MNWVQKHLQKLIWSKKEKLIGFKSSSGPKSLQQTGSASTRAGCSGLSSTKCFQAGASSNFLGNLCQSSTTLLINNFFLPSSLNLPLFNVTLLPSVLLLPALLERLSTLSLKAPFRPWNMAINSPCSLVLSRMGNPSSLSHSLQKRCSVTLTCSDRSLSSQHGALRAGCWYWKQHTEGHSSGVLLAGIKYHQFSSGTNPGGEYSGYITVQII